MPSAFAALYLSARGNSHLYEFLPHVAYGRPATHTGMYSMPLALFDQISTFFSQLRKPRNLPISTRQKTPPISV